MVVNVIENVLKKKGLYELSINKKEYLIDSYFYECILPYKGKKLNVYQMLDIIAFSNAYSTLKYCYKKIFNHEMSTYELKVKLSNKQVSEDYIERVVGFLKNEGHLKEEDIVLRYIDYYQEYKGKKAFQLFLTKKKISKKRIDWALDNFIENKENALLIAKKYIRNKVSSNAMLKAKVNASLLAKGYSNDTISYVLSNLTIDNEDSSLIKEIKKYETKYPNDYYKVYSKLLSKGYESTNIKKYLKKEGFNNEDC